MRENAGKCGYPKCLSQDSTAPISISATRWLVESACRGHSRCKCVCFAAFKEALAVPEPTALDDATINQIDSSETTIAINQKLPTMGARFVTHDEQLFQRILGPQPTLDLLLEDHSYPFAHEAGVFFPATDEFFITSNRFYDQDSDQQRVQISKVTIRGEPRAQSTSREEVDSLQVPQGNGGVNYGEDSILFCAQGSSDKASGLYAMSSKAPYSVTPVLLDFYGRPFNSVNDVVIHSDGSIWFTDPSYGFEQGYRPRPSLPSQVYRYDPRNKSIRAVADGFGHPNGLCFSPDEKTMYITDTDRQHGSGVVNDSNPSTM